MRPSAPSASRLGGLDGLRAVAAITVLSYHIALWSRFAFAGSLAPVLWALKGGVAVFFVISGAVLYLPYARAIRDGERLPDWRRYARRRAVRIVPAYWLALTAVALGPFAAGVLGRDLWRYYGLSQIYGSGSLFGGLGVAWSLCVEVSFYAVLPLLARLTARLANRGGGRVALRAQLVVLVSVGLVCVLMRGLLAGSLTGPVDDRGLTLTVALPGFLDWFAIGMGVAVLATEREAGRARGQVSAALARRPGWCLVLALAAFGVAIPAQHADVFLPWYGLLTHVMLGIGSGFLVLAAIALRPRSPVGVLRSACLTWLGTISYGIYLWHLVVLELVSRQPAPRGLASAILLWLLVLAGAVALGAASWYLVERPLQRALRVRERREDAAGRMPEMGGGVQPVADGLNPARVAADHLA